MRKGGIHAKVEMSYLDIIFKMSIQVYVLPTSISLLEKLSIGNQPRGILIQDDNLQGYHLEKFFFFLNKKSIFSLFWEIRVEKGNPEHEIF